MLHELLPKKLTNLQWVYSSLGLVASSIAIMLENQKLFLAGIVLLSVGGVLFFIIILKIIRTHVN